MSEVLQTMRHIGVIPVIAIEDAGKAVSLAGALAAGGLPAAEITFRTAAGEAAIREISRECPEILLGAGTVLNLDQCDRAINAGARFIVSPGYNETLVDYCVQRGVEVFPGCVNASDMTRAVNAGLKTVKFFPAEQSGGLGFLKAMAPVLPLNFIPTGGINTENLMEYLSFDRVAACGGTWMVKKDLIEHERWDEITALCRNVVKTMLNFELRSVRIRCAGDREAEQTAGEWSAIFDPDCEAGRSVAFAGGTTEFAREEDAEPRGVLTVTTRSVDRAIYHLGLRGVKFDRTTQKTDENGRTMEIYLKQVFGGFAVHLLQK